MAHLTLQSVADETISAGGLVLAGGGGHDHRPAMAPLAARRAAGAAGFEQLVADHEPRVRRLAHRLLGWRNGAGEVDDVVQDVFLAALKGFARFRGDSSAATWLLSVTINRCRARQRRDLLRLRWLRLRSQANVSADAANASALMDETTAQVRSAVQALPARDREVVVLFYLEQLPAAEVAELLGLSRGAVNVRLHRARARLKATLADFISDEP